MSKGSASVTTENSALVPARAPSGLAVAGQVANAHAAKNLFADYRARKATNTILRHDGVLALFADFLATAGIPNPPTAHDLTSEPAAWRGVTWGLVSAFVKWLLGQGYAVGSVNGDLSILKTYCRLAAQAAAIPTGDYALIRAITGYRGGEAKHVDETRDATRIGLKKAMPVTITREQAAELKRQPDTPQGRRDALLTGLLLDLGLRCGEVAGLTVANVNLKDGLLTFYRPKVGKEQTHRLTNGLLRAMQSYLANDAPAMGQLLRASNKGGVLTTAGMTERAITMRVRELGERIGVMGLSAHDCRHHWATRAARNGTPLDRLQDAGGWSSPAMPLRYVEAAAIANEGVNIE